MRETVGEFTANELKSKLYSAKYSILGGEYRKSGNSNIYLPSLRYVLML